MTTTDSNDREDVVTVIATVGDGTVVRWYIHEAAEENGYDYMSASRNGVMIGTFLHKVPEQALADAKAAFEMLRRGDRDGVERYATHKRHGFHGPLERIDRTPDQP